MNLILNILHYVTQTSNSPKSICFPPINLLHLTRETCFGLVFKPCINCRLANIATCTHVQINFPSDEPSQVFRHIAHVLPGQKTTISTKTRVFACNKKQSTDWLIKFCRVFFSFVTLNQIEPPVTILSSSF